MSVIVTLIGKDRLSPMTVRNINAMNRLGKSVARVGIRYAKFGALATAALGVAATKSAADLDKGIREIGTLMTKFGERDVRRLTKEMEDLASASGKAVKELVGAKYQIVSRGFKGIEESSEIMRKSLELSIGGVSSINNAAKLLIATINAYGKENLTAARAADDLFTIVRLGGTTINELSLSMGRMLTIAAEAGVSIEELGAGIVALTLQGLNTEEAITAIRASIVEMINPSDDLAKALRTVTSETGATIIKTRGYVGALEALKKAAENGGDQIVEILSNIRSMTAVLPIVGSGATAFAEALLELGDNAGSSNKAFKVMINAFSTDAARLKQNLANVIRSIGRRLITIIQPAVRGANEIFSKLGDIGWDAVGIFIANNWRMVLSGLIKLTVIAGKIIKAEITAMFAPDIEPELAKLGRAFHAMQTFTKAQSDEFQNLRTSGLSMNEALKEMGINIGGAAQRSRDLQAEFMNLAGEIFTNIIVGAGDIAISMQEMDAIAQAAFDAMNKAAKEAAASLVEEDKKIAASNAPSEWAKKWNKAITSIQKKIEIYGEDVRRVMSAIGNLATTQFSSDIAQIDTKLAKDIERINQTEAAEESKATSIKKLEDIATKDRKKRANEQKAIARGLVIIETAVNIVEAFPSKFAMAAAFTVGALQLATINAQSFDTGGNVQRPNTATAADQVPAFLRVGEFINTPEATNQFGAEMERFNQIAESGGAGGGNGGINVTIQAFDARSFAEFARRNPRGFAIGIDEAVKTRNLTMTSGNDIVSARGI